jgi:ATP-dependent protease ClpP protease subunit
MSKLKKKMDESDMVLMGELEKIPCYRNVIPASVYNFYINGAIEGFAPYQDLIHVLKSAEEHDTIYIHLNSIGGELAVTQQIINSMDNTMATVITSLEGEAYSAASVILLRGHKIFVNPNVSFMAHNYSHGVGGKGNDVASHVEHSQKFFKKFAHSVYKDVMSKEEIDEMLSGKDFWFTDAELIYRLKKFGGREVITGSEELANEANEMIQSDPVMNPKKAEAPKKAPKKPAKKVTKK